MKGAAAIQDRRGSVMLEFVIVLPLYLVLFGGTFLTFELSLARLHLQESNRNLAWLTEDRHDATGAIAGRTHREARRYFDERNQLETLLGGGKLYGFGDHGDKTGSWGHRIQKFKEGGGVAKVDVDANRKILSLQQDNKWSSLYDGNMELEMRHVSAAYMGAIATSDILHKGRNAENFYEASYLLTRAKNELNGEAIVLHRRGSSDNRQNINTPSWDLTWMLLGAWPMGEVSLQTVAVDVVGKLSLGGFQNRMY